ncbi:MAG: SPFH domain-containing protein, partial [Gammaproteobacteria bacterium]
LGRYVGTLRDDGLRFVNPFTTRTKVSTRIRNHETSTLKVNDADGNPIEIAAVVVWQVADTARATFEVDDFVEYVSIQAETAVRHVANSFPYDAHGADELSLRDDAEEITERLSAEVSARVEAAGVTIIEGAVGMVETALDRLQERDVVVLDDERKAAMVSNLLVVLCGHQATQPVVNTGSLY